MIVSGKVANGLISCEIFPTLKLTLAHVVDLRYIFSNLGFLPLKQNTSNPVAETPRGFLLPKNGRKP